MVKKVISIILSCVLFFTIVPANTFADGLIKGNFGNATDITEYAELARLSGSTFTYTGEAICPTVSIDGLTEGVDFVVDYSNNVKCSENEAYATVYGVGNYEYWFYLCFSIVPNKPVISSISGSSGGVKLKWTAVDGADYYCIQRKTGSGNYVNLATIASSSYTDKTVAHESKYSYRVFAISNGAEGKCSASKSIKFSYFITPKLTSVTNSFTTVTVKWAKVAGADGYKLYEKKNDGSYKLVKTIKSGSTLKYVLKNRKLGANYTYRIKAISDDGSSSTYSSTKSVKIKLAAPTLKTYAYATSSTVKISWNKVAGADGYYVYRKTTDGKWKKIATVKGSGTLTYKNSSVSGKYLYAVKAYKVVDKKTYTSAYSKSITSRNLKSISAVNVEQYSDQFTAHISWKKITGATSYDVYYKKGTNGTWTKAKTTTALNCNVDITHGTHYYFKVRPKFVCNGVTTYGQFKEYDDWYMIYYTPNYSVRMLNEPGETAEILGIIMENNGPTKMRIYSDGAKTVDRVDKSCNRKLKLVDVDYYTGTGRIANIDYVDIPAYSSALICFDVVNGDGAVKYYGDTSVVFTFRYDNVKYTADCNNYYGHTYEFKQYA